MTELHGKESITVGRSGQQKWWQACILCVLVCLLIVQWSQLESWSFVQQKAINLVPLQSWWACCLPLSFTMPFLWVHKKDIQHILVVGPLQEILEFPCAWPISSVFEAAMPELMVPPQWFKVKWTALDDLLLLKEGTFSPLVTRAWMLGAWTTSINPFCTWFVACNCSFIVFQRWVISWTRCLLLQPQLTIFHGQPASFLSYHQVFPPEWIPSMPPSGAGGVV